MTGTELLDLFHRAKRRAHLIGTVENGIIVGLDLEGRIFTVFENQILNRVVPFAILNRSNKNEFLNPGGDALWPAPEGTRFGYEYNAGSWRVPPAITGAVWDVISFDINSAIIRAEVDLINNCQIGIPCEFERHIRFNRDGNLFIQNVTETIRYIGEKTLNNNEFRLAPWSLCQFDVVQGSEVVIPLLAENDIWDMYESSLSQRVKLKDRIIVDVKTDFRFQLALSKNVPWVEYVHGNFFTVKRSIESLPAGQKFIDIADLPPNKLPSNKGVKLSAYCDPSGFMETEACGGCTDTLVKGTELSVNVITEYQINNLTDNQ